MKVTKNQNILYKDYIISVAIGGIIFYRKGDEIFSFEFEDWPVIKKKIDEALNNE